MIIYLLSVLSLLLYQNMNIQAGNSALCFLTYRPAPEILQFTEVLAQNSVQYGLDLFIMIDDNKLNISNINTSSNIRLLQIANNECIQYGYQKTISLFNKWREITSWDKALLYFSLLNKNYSFVWLVEDDVFIPTVQAFISIHQLYSNTSDLIIPRNGLNLFGDTSTWHWPMIIGKFIPPWSCSMVNIVGLSRRMLVAIDNYVQWLGEVPFHEFFFNTLAMQLNLTIVAPTELSTIVYQAYHSPEQILKQPNNLWHPFKDLGRRKVLHKKLTNETLNHNNTIELTDIEILCDNHQNMTNIEQYLTKLISQFEIKKSQFSSNIRLSLRQRFINLVEQCQKRNASKQIISLAMKLADHAYKLPELPVKDLVIEKSPYHLRLELALKENKDMITRLPRNSSLLVELRKQGKNLTKELTYEMKREFQSQTKSSSRSSLSTTVISSGILFTSVTVTGKTARRLHILTRQNSWQIFDSIGNNTKILSLILLIFCALFALFQWQKVRSQKHFIIISILLLFFLLAYCVIL